MGIFLSFEDRNKTENDINDFLGKNVLFIHVHRLLKEGDLLRNFQRTTCFTDPHKARHCQNKITCQLSQNEQLPAIVMNIRVYLIVIAVGHCHD